MTEAFLYYLWKFKLLKTPLFTEDGLNIDIISPGLLNLEEGPDFQNAKIKIGDTLWAGNVEIHLKSSDWQQHQHNLNNKYQSIILHVVYQNDKIISLNAPVLELKDKFNDNLFQTYLQFMQSNLWIPCQNILSQVDEFLISLWLENLSIERLNYKILQIQQIVQQSNFNWEESFYIVLARAMGGKTNQLPFEMLARSLPLKIIAKHKNSLFNIESLLFGQAGYLDMPMYDDYSCNLQKEYFYLKEVYNLKSLNSSIWYSKRVHPNSFPTVRIAQFASLIYKSNHLLSKVLEAKDIETLSTLCSAVASSYWDEHYFFSKITKLNQKKIGALHLNSLIINAIIPFISHYADTRGDAPTKERMLQLLRQLPPEVNQIIYNWIKTGLKITDAAQSQAAIHLKNNYCDQKKCLQCSIGISLIKNG